MILNKDYLLSQGWKDGIEVVTKDFKDCDGEKYRMGWNIKTHRLYMGYGMSPCQVDTLEHLISILDILGIIWIPIYKLNCPMKKIIFRFTYKEDANNWLKKAKEHSYVAGGNAYRQGSYRVMLYGSFTDDNIDELRREFLENHYWGGLLFSE